MTFYHGSDPDARGMAFWPFVYLHGLAEDWSGLYGGGKVADDRRVADDYVYCDKPMPAEAGLYLARLYGRDVIVCLDARNGMLGGRLCGRAAILTTRGKGLRDLQHALTPGEWR